MPPILMPALNALSDAFEDLKHNVTFNNQLQTLLQDYAERPTPLYACQRLTQGFKAKIFLKREDLVHGGAHKTNQVLAQGLLAKMLKKRR
ncbi:MAG TPA: tryptophan synthase subunit beta, partial [Candidatus Berkiella sp.]|nr:tryptophan synthase subunit beta [Candidatus Berkiella sp.]